MWMDQFHKNTSGVVLHPKFKDRMHMDKENKACLGHFSWLCDIIIVKVKRICGSVHYVQTFYFCGFLNSIRVKQYIFPELC